MPEGLGREGGLQEIRNCIRRLRVEKKVQNYFDLFYTNTFIQMIFISFLQGAHLGAALHLPCQGDLDQPSRPQAGRVPSREHQVLRFSF